MRFTEEERQSVEHFMKWFGGGIQKYFVVLFTRIDELEKHNTSLQKHLERAPCALNEIIKKCGGRVFAFNNDLKDDEQVQNLLQGIANNVQKNGGGHYTNDMYRKAEEEIKKIENEKLVKEKKVRDKEYQRIIVEIENQFTPHLKQETENLQHVQAELRELIRMYKESKEEIENIYFNRKEELKREIAELEFKYAKEMEVQMNTNNGNADKFHAELEEKKAILKQLESRSKEQGQNLELNIQNLEMKHTQISNQKLTENDANLVKLRDDLKKYTKQIEEKKTQQEKSMGEIQKLQNQQQNMLDEFTGKMKERILHFERNLRQCIRNELQMNSLLGKSW